MCGEAGWSPGARQGVWPSRHPLLTLEEQEGWGISCPPPRHPPTTFRPRAVTVPPWEAADTTLLFLRRELVPGHPVLVWYKPDGTRVVSEGHTLVSLTGLRPVSGLKVGGRGQAEGAVP